MQLIFRPEAQTELLAAQTWYEARSPGLGFEFARSVDVAIARVQRAPLSFPRIEAEFRYVMARKFPYSIIYLVTDSQIVVVSCFHHRRKPGSWLVKDN